MNLIELFSGAGGATTGLEAAGFKVVGIERDESAVQTSRGAGHVVVEGDVRDLSVFDDTPVPDAMWSSWPCQPFSVAGPRTGSQDIERNGWPWTVSAIDYLKSGGMGPKWFMGENVVGLNTHRGACGESHGCLGPDDCPKAYFELVILKELRERFEWVGWRILDTADFGTPQHRRRIYIVGAPRPIRWPEPTHCSAAALGQPDLFGRTLRKWVSVGEALKIEGRVIGGGRNDSVPHRSPRTYRDLTDEPCTTIPAAQIGNAGPWAIAGSEPWRLDLPSPAVVATEEKGARHQGNATASKTPQRASDAVFRATGQRRLTISECATLQGFPEGYEFIGTKGARYRQVGNAVVPKMAELIGRAVLDSWGA